MKKLFVIIGTVFSINMHSQADKDLTGFDKEFLNVLLEQAVTFYNDKRAYIDENEDGVIQQSEADKVTYLELMNLEEKINSLQGIENFRNLEYFEFYNQPTKKIDLTKNKKLKSITINCNHLEVLAIYGLSELEELRIEKRNDILKKLNLKGINKLKIFDCQVKNIKLTNFEADRLIDLTCDYNFLKAIEPKIKSNLRELLLVSSEESVKIHNYDKLVQFTAGTDSYPSNLFTTSEISFEKCPSLEFITCNWLALNAIHFKEVPKLVTLSCSGNNLTSLPFGDLQNLNSLNCDTNKFEQLDVSILSNLRGLSCKGNKISSLNLGEAGKLIALDCSYNKLTAVDTNNQKEIKSYNCSGNLLSTVSLKDLEQLESFKCVDNPNLESIVLKNISLREFYSSPSVKHICVDKIFLNNIKTMASSGSCIIDSDCPENAGSNFIEPDLSTIEKSINTLISALDNDDTNTLKYMSSWRGYEELKRIGKSFSQKLKDFLEISKQRGVTEFYANGDRFNIDIKNEKFTTIFYLFKQLGEWRYFGSNLYN